MSALGQTRPGRARTKIVNVRFAPKATVSDQNVICR
jgi:hypothetical protein